MAQKWRFSHGTLTLPLLSIATILTLAAMLAAAGRVYSCRQGRQGRAAGGSGLPRCAASRAKEEEITASICSWLPPRQRTGLCCRRTRSGKKTGGVVRFLSKNDHFYQDRLGKNTEKTQKQSTVVFQGPADGDCATVLDHAVHCPNPGVESKRAGSTLR